MTEFTTSSPDLSAPPLSNFPALRDHRLLRIEFQDAVAIPSSLKQEEHDIRAYLKVPEKTLRLAEEHFRDLLTQITNSGDMTIRSLSRQERNDRKRALYHFLLRHGAALHRPPEQGPAWEATRYNHKIPSYIFYRRWQLDGKAVTNRPLWTMHGVSRADAQDQPPRIRSGFENHTHLKLSFYRSDSPLRERDFTTAFLLTPPEALARAQDSWRAALQPPEERISGYEERRRPGFLYDFLIEKGAVLHRHPDAGPAFYQDKGARYSLYGEPAMPPFTLTLLDGVADITPKPPPPVPLPRSRPCPPLPRREKNSCD